MCTLGLFSFNQVMREHPFLQIVNNQSSQLLKISNLGQMGFVLPHSLGSFSPKSEAKN
uniref:Uncharacterized protein n=1 Tax=Rhizophora mucronata TaxID=61149 RepID=A0A2P2PRB7_RHIMU